MRTDNPWFVPRKHHEETVNQLKRESQSKLAEKDRIIERLKQGNDKMYADLEGAISNLCRININYNEYDHRDKRWSLNMDIDAIEINRVFERGRIEDLEYFAVVFQRKIMKALRSINVIQPKECDIYGRF